MLDCRRRHYRALCIRFLTGAALSVRLCLAPAPAAAEAARRTRCRHAQLTIERHEIYGGILWGERKSGRPAQRTVRQQVAIRRRVTLVRRRLALI